MYSSVGNINQTIGSSGCGPTCASMIVTATKGTITPDKMSDLFVRYGYRSANQGTYWSAFRAVADEFNIGYTETTDIQKALQLLQNNHYVVSSCGNGLFTTGGHFIVLTKVENGIIEVYDPYLYSGKFYTSTRTWKATVFETIGRWSRIGTNEWVCNTYLSESIISNSVVNSTIGSVKKLTKASILYSNSNLTGTQYNYKANTTITILQNISANVDRVRVNATGRIAYINNINYSNVSISSARGTVGKTRKTKSCIMYSNSNLTGKRYTYKANTTITILQNINSYIDRVRVNATGRYAYINVNNYR